MTPWIIGKTFTDETIVLHGRKHENCTFIRCRFETVPGPDVPYIVGCDFIDCPDANDYTAFERDYDDVLSGRVGRISKPGHWVIWRNTEGFVSVRRYDREGDEG